MISKELLDLVKSRFYEVVEEEATKGDKEEYTAYMNKMLKKYKVSSPDELDEATKKKFFEEVDKGWKSDAEESGVEESIDLITDKVYSAMIEEAKSGGKEEYDAFMKKMLEKYGVSSPKELDGDKKKKFFDEVDKEWESDAEKAGVEEGIDGNFTRDPGTVVNQNWKSPLSKNGSKNIKVFGNQGFKLLVSQLDKEKINYAVSTDDSTTVQVSLQDLPRVQKLAKYTGSKFAIED